MTELTRDQINRYLYVKMGNEPFCDHVLSKTRGPKRCETCGMLWSEWESYPDYCSDDSPRSLLNEVRWTVYNKIGFSRFNDAIIQVVREQWDNPSEAWNMLTTAGKCGAVANATAEQIARAAVAAFEDSK